MRFHHLHPGKHPRRGCFGGLLPGRLPDGLKGRAARRSGSLRSAFHRRDVLAGRPDADRPAPGGGVARLRPAEYSSLMCLGLVLLTYLTQGSCSGDADGLPGRHPRLIGLDGIDRQPRLTFGRIDLLDGIGLAPFVMGLFGLSEVLLITETSLMNRSVFNAKRSPGCCRTRRTGPPAPCPSAGTILLLPRHPGPAGAVISSFASYAIEKTTFQIPGEIRSGGHRRGRRSRSAPTMPPRGGLCPAPDPGIPPNVVMALLLGALSSTACTRGPC